MSWIKVKDKLPQIREVVLTLWNSGQYQVMMFCGGAKDNKSNWFGMDGEHTNVYHEPSVFLFNCIVYWMPLPSPPEENN
jgi:hypothetical protein